jgi:HlyD family secretion protein
MRWRPDFPDWPSLLRGAWPKRAALILVVLAAATYFFRDALFGMPVEIVEATRGDIVQTVVASGRIATPQRMSVGAVITGWVTRIPVDEGQTVQRGDVLIVLDDRDLRAAEAQAAAAVAQAEARIRQLREVALPVSEQGLVQAQANRVLARQQYERNLDLKA